MLQNDSHLDMARPCLSSSHASTPATSLHSIQSEHIAPPPPLFTLDHLQHRLHDVLVVDKELAQARARMQLSTSSLESALAVNTASPRLPPLSPSSPPFSLPVTDLSLQDRRASSQRSSSFSQTAALPSTSLALPELSALRQAWYKPHNWSPSLTSSMAAATVVAQSTASSSLNPVFAASSALHLSKLASDNRRGVAQPSSLSCNEPATLIVPPAVTTLSTGSDNMLLEGNGYGNVKSADAAATSDDLGAFNNSGGWPRCYTHPDTSEFGKDEPMVIVSMKRCASCGGVEMLASDASSRRGQSTLSQRRKTVCYACGLRFARVAQQSSMTTIQQRRRRRQSGSAAVDAAALLSQNVQSYSQEGEPLKRMHLHMSGSDGGGGVAPSPMTMATPAVSTLPAATATATEPQVWDVAESDMSYSPEELQQECRGGDSDQENDSGLTNTAIHADADAATATSIATAAPRRFPCPYRLCDNTFSTSGHARRHNRTVHENATLRRTIVCPFKGCNTTFTRRDNCTQHQRMRHGGDA